MRINLEFDSVSELDEFVARFGKSQTVGATAPKDTAAPKAPAPKEPAPKDTPAAPKADSKSETTEISYAKEVAPRVLKLAEAKGRPAAIALLEKFGVKKAPDLKADQYADFIAAADAALAE